VRLFHTSPSSASHWLLFMPVSSVPDPQPPCIGLGPGKTQLVKNAHNQPYNTIYLYLCLDTVCGWLTKLLHFICPKLKTWLHVAQIQGWTGTKNRLRHFGPDWPTTYDHKHNPTLHALEYV